MGRSRLGPRARFAQNLRQNPENACLALAGRPAFLDPYVGPRVDRSLLASTPCA